MLRFDDSSLALGSLLLKPALFLVYGSLVLSLLLKLTLLGFSGLALFLIYGSLVLSLRLLKPTLLGFSSLALALFPLLGSMLSLLE